MTITTSTARNDYVGAGSTGPYAYTFKIFSYAHLALYTQDLNGTVTTLNYLTDFTATGKNNAAGGTITLTTALTTGWLLSIQRQVPLTQSSDFRNQAGFFPADYEDAVDYATMEAQTLNLTLARAAVGPPTVTPGSVSFTLPVPKPGYVLGWNAAGNGFGNVLLNGGGGASSSASVPNTLVLRDGSGNFAAASIAASQLTITRATGGITINHVATATNGPFEKFLVGAVVKGYIGTCDQLFSASIDDFGIFAAAGELHLGGASGVGLKLDSTNQCTLSGPLVIETGGIQMSGGPSSGPALDIYAVAGSGSFGRFFSDGAVTVQGYIGTSDQLYSGSRTNFGLLAKGILQLGGGGTSVGLALSATNACTLTSTLKIGVLGAFAASDKYLVVDASGNVHVSALGPAS
jgi:hypothetical protein